MGVHASITININRLIEGVVEMYARAMVVLAGVAVGSVLGATAVAQAKVPVSTYALKNGYYNETPASTGLRETCDYYTVEANRYLANGQTPSAQQFVAEVNQAKGCTIVYHSYSYAQVAY